jgi:hypothetical protein
MEAGIADACDNACDNAFGVEAGDADAPNASEYSNSMSYVSLGYPAIVRIGAGEANILQDFLDLVASPFARSCLSFFGPFASCSSFRQLFLPGGIRFRFRSDFLITDPREK